MEEKGIRQSTGATPKERSRESRSVFKILLTVLLTVLTVILLLGIAVSLYLDHVIGLMDHVDGSGQGISSGELEKYIADGRETMAPDFSGTLMEPEDVALETVEGAAVSDSSVINILLIGHDARPGETHARSDSMILCSLDKATGELTLISFMRDMYVNIPDYCDYKMNAAYAWGDMKLLNETILVNFGIEIDGDLAVDFTAFEKLIDYLGGVDIQLTAAEARYLNRYSYSEGVNCLNGADALTYTRIRSIGDADFTRTSRQQNVIRAIVEKCKALSLSELNGMIETVLPLVATNMEPGQIKAFATELLPLIADIKLNTGMRIPADGTYEYAWISGMSVLLPDLAKNRELLHNAIYGP